MLTRMAIVARPVLLAGSPVSKSALCATTRVRAPCACVAAPEPRASTSAAPAQSAPIFLQLPTIIATPPPILTRDLRPLLRAASCAHFAVPAHGGGASGLRRLPARGVTLPAGVGPAFEHAAVAAPDRADGGHRRRDV